MKIIMRGVLMASLLAAAISSSARAVEGKDAGKKDAYPLDTCIVSGKKLADMGAPFAYDHKGRTIMFCCKGCVAKFEANTDEYVKKLDDAIITMQKPTYPMLTCVVSGDKLDEPIHYIYMNRLVEFCCKDCIKSFSEEPAKYLKQLDEAAKSGTEKAGEKHGHEDHGEHK